MDHYSWNNCYVWNYNQVRNIEDIVNNVNVDEKKANSFFIQQVLGYTGNGIFQYLPNNVTTELLVESFDEWLSPIGNRNEIFKKIPYIFFPNSRMLCGLCTI